MLLEAFSPPCKSNPALRDEETLAFMACKALLAYSDSSYGSCLEWLERLRPIAHRCGGSLAQCDVLHLTNTEAALRSGHASLARALVAERTANKPVSPFNNSLQRRLKGLIPSIGRPDFHTSREGRNAACEDRQMDGEQDELPATTL
jgi:hypothetical protein